MVTEGMKANNLQLGGVSGLVSCLGLSIVHPDDFLIDCFLFLLLRETEDDRQLETRAKRSVAHRIHRPKVQLSNVR